MKSGMCWDRDCSLFPGLILLEAKLETRVYLGVIPRRIGGSGE